MELQDFYDRLIRVARLNPRVTTADAQMDDPCHPLPNSGEPPLCLSPQDLLDPTAKNIEFDDGQSKYSLGPMEVLESYRQLVRLDQSDGKFDSLFGSKTWPMPKIPQQPISSVRYYGPQWTPDVRLQTFLRTYQGELNQLLPKPDPTFDRARFYVAIRAETMKEISYPLMRVEQVFVTQTAGRLQQLGCEYAANLVFDTIAKSRVVPYRPVAPEEDLARTLYFLQKDNVAVFYSAVFEPNGKHHAFHNLQGRPLRGITDRNTSMRRLHNYLNGKPLQPGEFGHVKQMLRDLYIYRYLYYTPAKGVYMNPNKYFQTVVLHESLHAAALTRANGEGHNGQNHKDFDWEVQSQKLLVLPPKPAETEKLVEFLADLLNLQRAALEVKLGFERIEENQSLSDAEKQGLKMVRKLEVLVGEASEFLVDTAAWELTFGGKLSPGNFGSPRDLIFNPNEEEVLTKILPP